MNDELMEAINNLGIITTDDVERLTAVKLLMLLLDRYNELVPISKEFASKVDNLYDAIEEVTEQEVIELLKVWKVDGTLDQLINQIALAEVNGRIDNIFLEQARGSVNLFIETPFDGGNQPYHPSVVNFSDKFNGYKYWMAYTPYPFGDDNHEDPCIVASNDLLKWVTPSGIKNPIDTATNNPSVDYWSDTELFYNNSTNKMELWYRGIKGNSGFWVRRTSSNGVEWSDREVIHEFSGVGTVSVSVIFENGVYKIWTFSPNEYYETNDATNWGTPKNFVTNEAYWHGQVRKTTKGYEMFAHPNYPNNLYINHLISTDGLNFEKTLKVISSNGDRNIPHGIDSKGIYRPCFFIENGRYYLFYCTGDNDIKKGITLSISKNLDLTTLKGIDESHIQYMAKPTFRSKYGFEGEVFDLTTNKLYKCQNPSKIKGTSTSWNEITKYEAQSILTLDMAKDGYHSQGEGKLEVANSDYYLSKYIEVEKNDLIIFNKLRWDVVTRFDENKQFHSHVSINGESENEVVVIPDGVKYIKINIYKPWLDDLKITRVNLDRLCENPYRWSKGGISLTGKWFDTQKAYTSEDIFVNSAYSYDITDLTKNTDAIKFSEFDANGNFITRKDFNTIQSYPLNYTPSSGCSYVRITIENEYNIFDNVYRAISITVNKNEVKQ